MPAANAQEESGALNLSANAKIVVLASGIFPAMALAGMLPILPTIAGHFADVPNAPVLTRLLVTVLGIMTMISAPLVGTYLDALGPRRIALVVVAAYGIAGGAGFFLDNLYALLASRAIVGFSAGAIGAVMLAQVMRFSTGAAQNRWFGYISVMSSFGSVILVPISGALGHISWHLPFLMYFMVLPLVFSTLVGFPPDPRSAKSARGSTDDQEGEVSKKEADSGPCVGFLVFALLCGSLITGPFIFVPFRLADIGVNDPQLISYVIIPSIIIAGIAALVYGRLRRSCSLAAVFTILFAFAAAGLAIVALSGTFSGITAGMLIYGVAVGVAAPNLYAMAAGTGSENRRPQNLGFAKTGIYGGPIISQFLLEPVIVKFATQGAFIVLVALAVIMAIRETRILLAQRAAAAA